MDHTFDNLSDQSTSPQPVIISAEIKNYLSETAKWGRFLGIMGFIAVGLMVIFGLFFGTFMSRFQPAGLDRPNPMSGAGGVVMAIYFMLIGLLYFFPSLYLYQFAVKTKNALQHNDALDYSMAFSRLKSFFKFWGIFTIVALSFYVLALIGIGMFAVFMKHNEVIY